MQEKEVKQGAVIRTRTSKTFKGEKLLSARDICQKKIQETLIPVLVGADVKALYSSLSDMDIARICDQVIIDTKITFMNINYKLATK